MHTTNRQLVLAGAAVTIALSTPVELKAQGAQPDTELEEVVVTARKRDESFRDVPITVNVFTAEQIEAAGIERPADFIELTPNMTLVETQNAGNAFVVIRGISQARNSEPSVAVLVDGVLETNPAQFNQELFDIEAIEVLKGPQGALYGRNAIGGAILIRTREPGDELQGMVRLGADSGPGWRGQASLGGPIAGSETWKFQAALSYMDTDGYINNAFLDEEADPYEDLSGRIKLLYRPNDTFRADLRLSGSKLKTQALYFNIVQDVNDTSLPVRVNNPGQNDRDMYNVSLKLDYQLGGGTLTSITAYDDLEEILTGDQFDFLPIPESFFFNTLGFDLNQSQFLDVDAWSQELRYTSTAGERVQWIVGAYYVSTDRFISTGNMVDTGNGVFPVYRQPSTNPLNPQATFLADAQDNSAWAVFADVTVQLNDRTELDLALRYDEDEREQTTLTPEEFLPNVPGFPEGFTGQVREETWSELQPRVTLRYKPAQNLTWYGGYSRGFRSGGFNQTGVGAVAASTGILGVRDIFDAEVADTYELGFKGQFMNGRLNTNAAVYHTRTEGSYFFVFLAQNSTQNLGNLDEVEYQGFEFDINARPINGLDLFLGFGYTDSEIKEAADPTTIGNQAPLVSEYTINAAGQYRWPINSTLSAIARVDYQRIGDTWWDPANSTVRDPVDLIDARLGIEAGPWSVTAWGKNLNDKKYNAEFSPGGFVFKAKPRRYGIDVVRRF